MPATLSTRAATGDGSEDAASHATTHALDADAAHRHRRADAGRRCRFAEAMLMCQPPPPPRGARLRELEAGQRVALHAHAMHMWGARWQQSPDEPVVTLRAS